MNKQDYLIIVICWLFVITVLQIVTICHIYSIEHNLECEKINNHVEEIITEEPTTEEVTTEEIYITTESITTAVDDYISTKSDSVLTASKGVNYNSDGCKETYYNLPMSCVVKIMRDEGFSEEEYPYWIREDGVKMLGKYVMVAANLNAHPRGTLVNTSLGTGIVCDTGVAVSSDPMHLDIAVDW